MKFDVRYFMDDLDIKYIEDNSEQYDVLSDYMPKCIFAGSIEIACLQIKARGWIAYPFKHEDGSFSVWAWPEGLLIRLTWEIPPKNEEDKPLYDFTFVEFSPLTFKKKYTANDYHYLGIDDTMHERTKNIICRKITFVNRSSSMD